MSIAIVHSPEDWAAHFGNGRKRAAVTIGNFDGVHLGHQTILRRLLSRARSADLMGSLLTFHPHPTRVLRPAAAPSLLETLDQRLAAIAALGVEAALVARFDDKLAGLGPEDFVQRFLGEAMRAQVILIGGNFRFGHDQAGDAALLARLGQRWGFEVEVVPPVMVDGVIVSSTAIRGALQAGEVDEARRLLGRPFSLAGAIQTGTGQGRKLVVPTLNLATEQELLPKNGVYATEAVVEGKAYSAVTNVGVRPTFDGSHTTVESHLFDFSEMRTRGNLEVRFYSRLRDERKFSGPAELREQILRDIEQAKDYFRALPRPSRG